MLHRANFSRIGAKNVVFNGTRLDEIFILDEIMLSIMPTITTNTQQVPGRAGDYLLASEIGSRSGRMRVSLNTQQKKRIESITVFKELFDVFITDEAKKLQLGDFYVYAQFINASDYDQVGIYGSTTLDFVCYDPYLYYKTVEVSLKNGTNNVICTSQEPVFPYFELIPTSSSMTIRNTVTGDQVVIPSGLSSTKKLTVDMERERCESAGSYVATTNASTDYFMLTPGENKISITNGSGKLTFKERRL